MSSTLHPDSRLNPSQDTSNDSGNPSIVELIAQREISRRSFLKTSFGATTAAVLGTAVVDGLSNYANAAPPPLGGIGFTAVPPNVVPMSDRVTVPEGYEVQVLVSWGDALDGGPHWDPAGAMDEATQLRTFGAHTDGMHYFPFPPAAKPNKGNDRIGNEQGLLVCNHEYVDPPLANNIRPRAAYASAPLSLEMVRAQQAAHGISVVEVRRKNRGKDGKSWEVKRPSAFNRRITGNTPCTVSGPAAGHPLLRTMADASGMLVLGTLNNCAHGHTPWGTYLACEENWNGYFGTSAAALVAAPLTAHERRYGVSGGGFGYRWHEADPRFDIRANPNEPNRFGWVVEIDPARPDSTPVKRTALGRFKHEGAWVVVGDDQTVAVYMGDDERNEYIYKFVCARKYNPRNPAANRDLLDDGVLYVARFDSDGSGAWLPLVWGMNGLTPENGFADQGEVVIKARQAADRVGATMMDRPEWGAVHPLTREVYMTLTNNSRRGNTPASVNSAAGTTTAASANPPVDAANPRPDNDYGHIIRWRETGGDVAAATFEWDIFVQCGDKSVFTTAKQLGGSYNPANLVGLDPGDPLYRKAIYAGNINGDDYGAPDGLWFDNDGRLWIQTDQQGDARGDWVNIGGNAMMCADPSTGQTKRFLTSPPNCEVTGVVTTPDGKTMFVGIQHPGEDWINDFTENSAWPDNGQNGSTTFGGSVPAKPRSAVVVISKRDGGVIGT
jgi:secreted PhoX family phosphatase